jgi:hypothetical protein
MKHFVEMGQWYITHTCNLSCENCLSYNNYKISGHERWEENEDHVKAWSERVYIEDCSIIGGEPFANPDIHKWAMGVRKYFDTKDLKVCTNGTYLEHHIDNIKQWIDNGIVLEIQYHDPMHKQKIDVAIKQILGSNTHKITGRDWHGDPDYYDEFDEIYFVDNRVAILVVASFEFYTHTIDGVGDAEFTHKFCAWRDCHYFYRGELYKCGALVGAQGMAEKFDLLNKDIITQYKPVNVFDNDLGSAIKQLQKSVPQCAMCNTKKMLNKTFPVGIKKVDYEPIPSPSQ